MKTKKKRYIEAKLINLANATTHTLVISSFEIKNRQETMVFSNVAKLNTKKSIQLENVFNKDAYAATNESIKFKSSKLFKLQKHTTYEKCSTHEKKKEKPIKGIQHMKNIQPIKNIQ